MTTLTPETVRGPVGEDAHTPARGLALRQLGLMLQWQLRRSAQYLPLLVVIQMMLAIASVIGYGLIAGHPSAEASLYLATGAPTITLITIGLVMAPQSVMQSKTEGSLDWLRTLPVPREVFLFSDLAMWTLLGLPGTVLGVIAGSAYFGVALAPTWWLVPAVVLVSLTSSSIGYAIGTVLHPTVAHLISQVLVFTVMLFTPISYPAERLPQWAQSVHDWLPLEPMAEAIRSGLAPGQFPLSVRSVVVLVIWCAASVAGAGLALRKRG